MKILMLVLALCVAADLDDAHGQAIDARPVKIAVRAQAHTIHAGDDALLICDLYDKENKPVAASQNLSIQIEAKSPSGTVTRTNVTFRAGQSSCQWQLPLHEVGVTEIKARNDKLIDRATFIMVKPGSTTNNTSANSFSAWQTNRDSPAPQSEPIAAAAPIQQQHNLALEEKVAGHLAEFNTRAIVPTTPSSAQAAATSVSVPAETSIPIGLILKCGSEKHLADGEDAASIFAFLDQNTSAAPEDINITLFNSYGKMIPIPMKISKGSDSAQAQLTSDRIGDVPVEFVRAIPKLTILGATNILLSFGPPISAFDVQASPVKISLLEKCDLVVRLLDKRGMPVATDEDRQASLSVDSGGGVIAKPMIVISSNQFNARVTFTPVWWGKTTIRASMANFSDSTATVDIIVPALVLTLSALGGMLGGAIAALMDAKSSMGSRLLRIGTGVVTGFIFYWACIFINSYVKLTPEIVLNPISTIVLATLGGFAGIKVLTGLLNLLGKS